MSGKYRKRVSLAAVCARKVSSTVKPSRASRSAGFRTAPRPRLPQVSSARCQVAGVPGVPTPRPLLTASANGERLAVLQEESGVGGQRGRLAAVEGVHRAGPGVVVDEVAASADSGRVGLGDAERGGRGDGRVHGVAALPQHLDPGGGGVGVDAGDRAAVADGDRGLGRVRGGRWAGRAWRRSCGAGGATAPTDNTAARGRQDRELPYDRATHPHLR